MGRRPWRGGVPLPQRVSIFYDFFTLKFSPVKFVQPLGGVVQNKYLCSWFSQNVLAEHKLDTYCGYLASHTHTQQHTTQDEPMLTLPPPALPSLSMETSSMDLNRGVAAPYEPNKGARCPGSRALRVFPLFGASKWRPSKN